MKTVKPKIIIRNVNSQHIPAIHTWCDLACRMMNLGTIIFDPCASRPKNCALGPLIKYKNILGILNENTH
jgi:hypothetical protein